MARLAKIRAFVLLSALAGTGCDDFWSDDDGHVTVRNHTDRTITVYYDRAYGEDESQWSKTTIRAGDRETIRIDSEFWDAEILVVYCGYAKAYDVDLDYFGWDKVNVYVWDFPVCE